jgi:hypothetical protein
MEYDLASLLKTTPAYKDLAQEFAKVFSPHQKLLISICVTMFSFSSVKENLLKQKLQNYKGENFETLSTYFH